MGLERRKLLLAYGAKLVLTEGARGMKGAVAKAEEMVSSEPGRYLLLQQFSQPGQPCRSRAHHGAGNLERYRRGS